MRREMQGRDCGLRPSDGGDCGRVLNRRGQIQATAVAPRAWPQTAVAALESG